jgi:hypothetical protein
MKEGKGRSRDIGKRNEGSAGYGRGGGGRWDWVGIKRVGRKEGKRRR